MIPTTSACGHLQYHGLISKLEGFGNDTPVHEIISTNAAESGNWPAKLERLIARSMNRNADGDPTDIASYLYLLKACRFSKPHAIRKVMSVRVARQIAVWPQPHSGQQFPASAPA